MVHNSFLSVPTYWIMVALTVFYCWQRENTNMNEYKWWGEPCCLLGSPWTWTSRAPKIWSYWNEMLISVCSLTVLSKYGSGQDSQENYQPVSQTLFSPKPGYPWKHFLSIWLLSSPQDSRKHTLFLSLLLCIIEQKDKEM